MEDSHDLINEEVGRQVWVGPYAAQECLVPPIEGDGQDSAPAGPQAGGDPGTGVFDRLYLPTDDHPAPLLVDLVLVGRGGAEQADAAKHVAAKRAWCKRQGVEYLVLHEDERYSKLGPRWRSGAVPARGEGARCPRGQATDRAAARQRASGRSASSCTRRIGAAVGVSLHVVFADDVAIAQGAMPRIRY